MATEKDLSPLFSTEGNDEEDGELFRDKVRALFEQFDADKDGHLRFSELGALQKATSGELLTEELYVMACRALDCTPQTGISLDALKLTYAAEGADIGEYYDPIHIHG
jgi:Ca2+-binding EF-hand superfamily protein